MAAITNVDVATGASYTTVDVDGSQPCIVINASAVVMTLRLGGAGDTRNLQPGEGAIVQPGATCELKHGASGNRTAQVMRATPLTPLSIRQSMGTPDGKTAVTVGSSSGAVLAANPARTHALIKADIDNSEAITIEIGGAAVVGEGIVLDPGEAYQIGPLNYTAAAINGICTSGGMTARVWES